MKVLQVIDVISRGGGAEKIVLDLTLKMKELGIEVEVLSIWNPYTVNKGEFCEILKKMNIPVHFLNNSKLYSFINIIRFHKLLNKNKYDVIHTHLFPALYYSSFMKVLNKSKQIYLYTEHSTDNRRRHIYIFKYIDAYIYKQFNKIVCITEAVSDALKRHIPNIETNIINNGINTDAFSNSIPISKSEIIPECSESDKFILMNARFAEAKDHMTLIKSMKHLPNNVHLLLTGSGELKDFYINFCRKEQLINRVHFLGIRNDIDKLVCSVDVNVLSSNYEGFSISMLEAMASGKPFIASEVPGIIDLIKDHTELFPHKNEIALAQTINKIITDESYANSISKKCKEFAMKYDITKTANSYIELYKVLGAN